MPRRKTTKSKYTKPTKITKTNKTTKRKTCKRSNKITGIGLLAIGAAIGPAIGYVAKGIMDYAPKLFDKANKAAQTAFSYASAIAGFIGPTIWGVTKYLSKTGCGALRNLITDMWKDTHKKTIDTNKIKQILSDLVKKLLLKDQNLKNHEIFYDITELNKMCYYIDNLNEEGMTQIMYEEMRRKVTEQLKGIFASFSEVMKQYGEDPSNPQEIPPQQEEYPQQDEIPIGQY